jgi:galactonate dehydratase
MAEAYDIGIAPHCPLGKCISLKGDFNVPSLTMDSGPLAFAACLQIGFCTPNFVVCEMSWKVSFTEPQSSF